MERESFIFYKSFYDAVKDLQKDIKLEVLTAIIEYALCGKEPENLKPVAKGMFVLVKPNLDVNLKRYVNGKKGGRRPISSTPPTTNDNTKTATTPKQTEPPTSFENEIEKLKHSDSWRDATCMQFHIEPPELNARLDAFVVHCNVERPDEPHATLTETRRHFCAWMRKVYPIKETPTKPATPDYAFSGGFGGQDT